VVVSNDHMYLIGGLGKDGLFKDVWRTSDGKSWLKIEHAGSTLSELPSRKDFCAVTINGYIYMIAGLGENRRKLKDVWKWRDIEFNEDRGDINKDNDMKETL